jgi:RNA polymerase sigma factor (sigma-70 family)
VDYEYIEKLVNAAKANDLKAKDNLVNEFTPLINSISKRTFIHGYETCDIKNECFTTLFICISKYKSDSHRFVAYATNAIKNNINFLIRESVKRNNLDGFMTLSLDDKLIDFLPSASYSIDEELCSQDDYNDLSHAIKNNLTEKERQLISFLFFKKNTLVNYADSNNISYVAASKRKKKVLNKLKKYINGGNQIWRSMISPI